MAMSLTEKPESAKQTHLAKHLGHTRRHWFRPADMRAEEEFSSRLTLLPPSYWLEAIIQFQGEKTRETENRKSVLKEGRGTASLVR